VASIFKKSPSVSRTDLVTLVLIYYGRRISHGTNWTFTELKIARIIIYKTALYDSYSPRLTIYGVISLLLPMSSRHGA
jgi:hypothetical protein